MNDTTPTTPAATICPKDGCHALVPDTIEDRREHRRGHTHRDKVDDAIRDALKDVRLEFAKLRGATRDELTAIRRDVEGIDRAVDGIEIPTPVEPMTINRGPWPEDDLDDEDDSLDDPRSTYIDDAPGAVISDATSMFTNYQPTPDDDYPPRGTVA